MDKEYIDREYYCNNICRCPGTECDKTKCPIWIAPAADVAPVVHSEWDYGDEPMEVDEAGNVQARCKRCGAGDVHAKRNINKVPYCWSCGAKMDGGKK